MENEIELKKSSHSYDIPISDHQDSNQFEINTNSLSSNSSSIFFKNSGDQSSSHNHGHNDKNCGHNHGSGHGHSHSHGDHDSGNFIQFFTMFMPCNCIILEMVWLHHNCIDNPFEYQFSQLSSIFILIMCFITYYQAVTIKNTPIKRVPPSVFDNRLEPIYQNVNNCESCKAWKPMRTSHCSTCGTCTLRMDHHCPWIVNCVGLRNHRAFYLFTVYMNIGGFQFLWKTYTYYVTLSESNDFWQHGTFFYIYWLFTVIVLVPITMMLTGLTIFHSMLIMTNSTTLETMKGTPVQLPCAPYGDPKKERQVNLFDRGVLANIYNFFEGDIFFFWLPFETITENDGTSYPINPPALIKDIQVRLKEISPSFEGPSDIIDINKANTDYEDMLQKEMEQCQEKNFLVDNQVFEFWKDYELMNKKQEAESSPDQQISNQNEESEKKQSTIDEDSQIDL